MSDEAAGLLRAVNLLGNTNIAVLGSTIAVSTILSMKANQSLRWSIAPRLLPYRSQANTRSRRRLTDVYNAPELWRVSALSASESSPSVSPLPPGVGPILSGWGSTRTTAWTCASTRRRTALGAASRASSTPNPTRASSALWSFKDVAAAKSSGDAIYERFLDYKAEGDFVGMDVARKYLQMGYTRSRRYAKYKGGNKSKPHAEPAPEKSRAAGIFYEKWREAAEDEEYLRLEKEHQCRNS